MTGTKGAGAAGYSWGSGTGVPWGSEAVQGGEGAGFGSTSTLLYCVPPGTGLAKPVVAKSEAASRME